MQLSANFTLDELTRSATASERGIDNTPGLIERTHLHVLAQTILQPLRDQFGPLRITSGYRSCALNVAIGGSKTSQHMLGQAADLVSVRGVPALTMAAWAWEHGLPFHQAIVEYRTRSDGTPYEWLHISKSNGSEHLRRECLTHGDGGMFAGFHTREGASA